jgi:hypothetical protein
MNKRHLYPADWEQISASIRQRAANCCEHCGVINHAVIQRLDADPRQYRYWNPDMPTVDYFDPAYRPRIKVILTVHHIGIPKPDGTAGDPNDKMDCRPANLVALCQACHFIADRANNIQKARVTRQRISPDQTRF